MSKTTIDSEVATLTARQKSCKREIGNKTITLAGRTYTGTALADLCQQKITADELVEELNRKWRSAVAAREVLQKQNKPVFTALKSYVQATYGKSSQTVADFGFKPTEETVKSVESKAAAVAKLRATRSARHTMGKVQRKGIKGSVPTLVPNARTAS
jgi:hypothetical protein